METIGFVVLNYCSWKVTIECVDSIINTYQSNKKIFVIDNASPDNSYNMLCAAFTKEEYKDVECILSDKNGGFAYGNNIGIRACQKEGIQYAVVTNNDVIFLEDTINVLVRDIKNNNNAVQIAPQILDVNLVPITMPWKRHQSLTQFLGLRSASELIYTEEELTGVKKVYMVSGCCFIIDIQKFANMKAFDEGTFLYMEEGTVAMSAFKYKYDIMYNSTVRVIHNHGYSTGRQNLFVDREIIKSGLYYWKKYEKIGTIKLCVLWMIMFLRSVYKILLGRVDKTGFGEFTKQTFRKLITELNATYDF